MSGVLAELIAFLAEQPTAVRRLLAQHVNDGAGNCRECAVGGQQGHLTWPCTIYSAAAIAAAGRNDAPVLRSDSV
jgi:hypothetical protein